MLQPCLDLSSYTNTFLFIHLAWLCVCVCRGQSLLLFDAAESRRQRLGHTCFSRAASVLYIHGSTWEKWGQLASALSNASCCVGLDVSADKWGTQILDLPEFITPELLKTRHTPAALGSAKPLCRPHLPAWITSFHSPLLNSSSHLMSPAWLQAAGIALRCLAAVQQDATILN